VNWYRDRVGVCWWWTGRVWADMEHFLVFILGNKMWFLLIVVIRIFVICFNCCDGLFVFRSGNWTLCVICMRRWPLPRPSSSSTLGGKWTGSRRRCTPETSPSLPWYVYLIISCFLGGGGVFSSMWPFPFLGHMVSPRVTFPGFQRGEGAEAR